MRDFNAELHNVMKNGINRPSAEALKPVKTRQPRVFVHIDQKIELLLPSLHSLPLSKQLLADMMAALVSL